MLPPRHLRLRRVNHLLENTCREHTVMINIHLWFEVLNLLVYSSVRIAFGAGVFLVDMFETLAFVYRVIKIRYILYFLFTWIPGVVILTANAQIIKIAAPMVVSEEPKLRIISSTRSHVMC